MDQCKGERKAVAGRGKYEAECRHHDNVSESTGPRAGVAPRAVLNWVCGPGLYAPAWVLLLAWRLPQLEATTEEAECQDFLPTALLATEGVCSLLKGDMGSMSWLLSLWSLKSGIKLGIS